MKPPKILRPIRLSTTIPEDVRAKLDLYLYSEVEGRVPFGAYQKFIVERTQEFFAERRKYLTDAECTVVRRLLSEVLQNGSQEWPQEAWISNFVNGEEAYLLAKSLMEKLR